MPLWIEKFSAAILFHPIFRFLFDPKMILLGGSIIPGARR
jgi:hypothetical protein